MKFLPLNVKAEYTSIYDSIKDYLNTEKIKKVPPFLQFHILRFGKDETTQKLCKISRRLGFQFSF